MKIALYHNLLSGGAKRAIYEMMSRLSQKHTFDVFTLTCSNHEFADLRPFANQYRLYDFQPGKLFRSPFGRLNTIIRLRDLNRLQQVCRRIAADIDAGGYDVVYAQPCQFENSPAVLRFLQRTPSVFFCQESLRVVYEQMPARPYDRHELPRRRFLNRIDPFPHLFRRTLKTHDRESLRAADVVIVNSLFVRDTIARIYGVDSFPLRLGVDTNLFRRLPYEKKDFVLSVGSLTPLKGFDFIIRSLGLIPSEKRPPLLIASNFQNPPERDYLTQLAAENGVDLTLQGGISDDLLVQLYNQARLTVYTPIREPFGLVALESLACGTPLVSVRDGGLQETVADCQTGLLTDRVEADYARAVSELLADPVRRITMGHHGEDCVRTGWNWDCTVEDVEASLVRAAAMKPA